MPVWDREFCHDGVHLRKAMSRNYSLVFSAVDAVQYRKRAFVINVLLNHSSNQDIRVRKNLHLCFWE